MNDFKKTKNELEKQLLIDPGDADAWLKYAIFLKNSNSNPSAMLKSFEKAQSLAINLDLGAEISESLYECGRQDEAFHMILTLLSLNESEKNLSVFANMSIRSGMNSKALAILEGSIHKHNNSAILHFLLGVALVKSDRKRAIIHFKTSIEINGTISLHWRYLGASLVFYTESIDEGISALQKSIEINSEDPYTHVILANAYWRINALKKAQEHYLNAIHLSGDEINMFEKFYLDFRISNNID